MARKVLKLYITISFLLGLSDSFFFATYVVFLFSKGLDLMEINLINTFFMISAFFLEIPTGAIADLFGRKKSIVLGCFVFSLSMLAYYLSNEFWFFVFAEVIAAISVTLLSGATEAWIVDSLRFYKFDGLLHDVFKREKQFKQLGIVLGSMAGAYIGSYNIALPWLISSIASAGVGIFCWVKMKEEYFEKRNFELSWRPIGRIARNSVLYGWKNKAVMYVIAFGAVLVFSVQAFNMQWQLVFKESFGISTANLGWIFAGMSLFIVLGNQLSVGFTKLIKKEKDAIILSQVITVIGMIVASSMIGLTTVLVGFFVHELGRGMIMPLKQSYLNHRIPSDKRATILSFDSMVFKGGAALGLIFSGYLANNYSISLAWLASGIVLAISIPIFLNIKNGE